MITKEEFNRAEQNVKLSFTTYLPDMISYKKHVQTAILDMTTPDEMKDIVLCKYNDNLVCKLVKLAHDQWKGKGGDTNSLYCAAMAVGTIIKEYDWGTKYISPDGLYEMAKRIYEG